MHGLPFLPGNNFVDRTKSYFPLPQTMTYKNGYAIPSIYHSANPLTQSELDELANFSPTLTYGKAKQEPPKNFVPAHVAFDKKVLRFYGYFKETVNESPQEHYRVHNIVIYYYLEDDSICVNEPHVANSGMPQGVIIRRQRLPKNEVGDFYSWKDFNLGMNFCIYGRVYRITDCDAYTRHFLESEGIDVAESEKCPEDPYMAKRYAAAALTTSKTKSSFDQRRQFIEMDKKVLRFYAIGDERDKMYGDARYFIIQYYLVDDTLEVRENHQPNDGRDPFPLLIRRDRIPKNRYDVSPTFPSITLELSDNEIKSYFTPSDLKIGATLVILGRRFLIYDCDNFTKAWYYRHFKMTDFTPVEIVGEQDRNKVDATKLEKGPLSDPAAPEDKFIEFEGKNKSSFSLMESALSSDTGQKTLRYEAILDSIRPEDQGRRFIISYRLSDCLINIFEPPIRNSGIVGGTFLYQTRIAKPGSTLENPEYYSPCDFYIGAKLEAFGNRFIIVGCDEYVVKFLEVRKDQIPAEVLNSLREYHATRNAMPDKMSRRRVKIRREPGDLERMVREIKCQLKKMAVTDRTFVYEMFLRYNKHRHGHICVSDVQNMCRKMNLPDDEDIITTLMEQCGTDGKMNLEQFRNFIEN